MSISIHADVLYKWKGEMLTAIAISRMEGIGRSSIWRRLKSGMDIAEAIAAVKAKRIKQGWATGK